MSIISFISEASVSRDPCFTEVLSSELGPPGSRGGHINPEISLSAGAFLIKKENRMAQVLN